MIRDLKRKKYYWKRILAVSLKLPYRNPPPPFFKSILRGTGWLRILYYLIGYGASQGNCPPQRFVGGIKTKPFLILIYLKQNGGRGGGGGSGTYFYWFYFSDCEPGLVLKEIKTDPTQNGMTKEVLRKVELKEMKAKYGLGVGLKVWSPILIRPIFHEARFFSCLFYTSTTALIQKQTALRQNYNKIWTL